jgi:hypothetical protein
MFAAVRTRSRISHLRLVNLRGLATCTENKVRSKLALIIPALAVVLLASPALAQEQRFRTVKAEPGKQVRLGLIANVTKECIIGPTLDVKVVTPPKHGTLAIRSGKTKAGSLKRCPTLEVPVRGVFYQANPNATGSDEVVYEIKRANGSTQTITAKIEIGAGQGSAKPDDDSTDL